MSDELNFSELEMEVFATGKWNNEKFEEADLLKLLNSFKEIGNQVKPYLKLGHNEEQDLAKKSGFYKDGKPALGWIDSLKIQGNKLVAKFKDVPKVIAELVNKKAYKRVSAEIYQDYERDGTKYPLVLKAISLLGGETPAVTTLQDIVALYEESTEEFKTIEFTDNFEETQEDERRITKMSEEKNDVNVLELEKKFADEKAILEKQFVDQKVGLEKQLAEQKAIVDNYTELTKMFAGVEDMKKAVLDFQAKQKEVELKEKQYTETIEKAKRDEIKLFVASLISENKILPFQQKMVEEILCNISDSGKVLSFSQSELYGLKEEMTLTETIRTLLKSNPDMGMLKEFTSQEKITSNPEELRAELEKKYMEDHKVEYGDAQLAVSKARPDLYGINK